MGATRRTRDYSASTLSRTRILIIAAGTVILGVAIAVSVGLARNGTSYPVPRVPFAKLRGLHTGPPPWDNGDATLNQRLPFLSLNALSTEGKKLHIHQHLDLYVNGAKVTVPADIGIQLQVGKPYITELHTHRPDGILHVESPVIRDFVLGQFFGEWGVKLTRACLGVHCGAVHWWVNGKPRAGNPSSLVLKAHQEIVVAFGQKPATVPASFVFPAGY